MQEVTILDLKQTKGRILGVDFGDTRTGLAVSDTSRFLVASDPLNDSAATSGLYG